MNLGETLSNDLISYKIGIFFLKVYYMPFGRITAID